MENKTKFERTEKEQKKALKGQAAVVLETLETLGQPATISEVASVCADALNTRQDPERVVAYYFCIFKKQGIVRALKPVPATVAAANADESGQTVPDYASEDELDTDEDESDEDEDESDDE